MENISIDNVSLKEFYAELYKSGSGLLLVKFIDPINDLFTYIMNEEYTSYGFYCPTRISGEIKILSYITDYSGIYNKNWKEGVDLDELIQNPLVERITIKKFHEKFKRNYRRGKNNFDIDLKLIIINNMRKYTNDLEEATLDDETKDLLEFYGSDLTLSSKNLPMNVNKKTSINNSLELINLVLDSLLETKNSLKEQFYLSQHLIDDDLEKYNKLCNIAFAFLHVNNVRDNRKIINNRINKLYKDNIFSQDIEIDLSNRSQKEIQIARERKLHLQRPKLELIYKKVFDEIITNQIFINNMIDKFKNKDIFQKKSTDGPKESLSKIVYNISNLNEIIYKMLDRKTINLNLLQNVYNNLNREIMNCGTVLDHDYSLMPEIGKLVKYGNITIKISGSFPDTKGPTKNINKKKIKISNDLGDQETVKNRIYAEFSAFSMDDLEIEKTIYDYKDSEDSKNDIPVASGTSGTSDTSSENTIDEKNVLDLQSFIEKITESLLKNEMPTIDINHLINITNKLSQDTKINKRLKKLTRNQIHDALIIVDDWTEIDMPIVFSNKVKIIITKNSSDEVLDKLTDEQLIELSIILNDICRDEKLRDEYSSLRNRVAKKRTKK